MKKLSVKNLRKRRIKPSKMKSSVLSKSRKLQNAR